MRRRVVSIILVIALIGLILPGCVPKTDLIEYQAVISEQSAQLTELASKVADLNTTIEEKDAEIREQAAQISELETQIVALNGTPEAENTTNGDTAKIEVTYNPNPVPCKDDGWHWTMMITEVNGVGVRLKSVTRYFHSEDGTYYVRIYSDVAWFEKWLNNSYLPAYSTAGCSYGFGPSAVDSGDYAVYVVVGVDDNGHKVEGSGRVDFEF